MLVWIPYQADERRQFTNSRNWRCSFANVHHSSHCVYYVSDVPVAQGCQRLNNQFFVQYSMFAKFSLWYARMCYLMLVKRDIYNFIELQHWKQMLVGCAWVFVKRTINMLSHVVETEQMLRYEFWSFADGPRKLLNKATYQQNSTDMMKITSSHLKKKKKSQLTQFFIWHADTIISHV